MDRAAADGLCPLACSESELTSETTNAFRYFVRTTWKGGQSIARSLPTRDSTRQTYRSGFEPTVLVFQQYKTIRALESAATGTGYFYSA